MDIVDYGIGLLYRPNSLYTEGLYDNPMQKSTISPQLGTKNLAYGLFDKDAALCAICTNLGGNQLQYYSKVHITRMYVSRESREKKTKCG